MLVVCFAIPLLEEYTVQFRCCCQGKEQEEHNKSIVQGHEGHEWSTLVKGLVLYRNQDMTIDPHLD